MPTPVPSKMYGQFYSGDAYIVLKTSQKQSCTALSWDLFFWLGDNCSQDEQGVAAYKTVEVHTCVSSYAHSPTRAMLGRREL